RVARRAAGDRRRRPARSRRPGGTGDRCRPGGGPSGEAGRRDRRPRGGAARRIGGGVGEGGRVIRPRGLLVLAGAGAVIAAIAIAVGGSSGGEGSGPSGPAAGAAPGSEGGGATVP